MIAEALNNGRKVLHHCISATMSRVRASLWSSSVFNKRLKKILARLMQAVTNAVSTRACWLQVESSDSRISVTDIVMVTMSRRAPRKVISVLGGQTLLGCLQTKGFKNLIQGVERESGRGYVVSPTEMDNIVCAVKPKFLVHEIISRSSAQTHDSCRMQTKQWGDVEIKLIVMLVSEEVVDMGVKSKLPTCPAEILLEQMTTETCGR